MPDSTDFPSKAMADDSEDKPQAKADDTRQQVTSTTPKTKEQEPTQAQEADDILKEIQERDKEADLAAVEKVREAIGEEARLREPEPQIPPDVHDAGVRSPDAEATKTIKEGATFQLPITEKAYQEAEHGKVNAKVTQKKEVFGVKSIVALAIYIGRLIKLAHHHVIKKVIFKKEGGKGAN